MFDVRLGFLDWLSRPLGISQRKRRAYAVDATAGILEHDGVHCVLRRGVVEDREFVGWVKWIRPRAVFVVVRRAVVVVVGKGVVFALDLVRLHPGGDCVDVFLGDIDRLVRAVRRGVALRVNEREADRRHGVRVTDGNRVDREGKPRVLDEDAVEPVADSRRGVGGGRGKRNLQQEVVAVLGRIRHLRGGDDRSVRRDGLDRHRGGRGQHLVLPVLERSLDEVGPDREVHGRNGVSSRHSRKSSSQHD